MAALANMFPWALPIPQPTEYFITRWGQEPLSYGSYSSIRPNATGNSSGLSPVTDIMAAPAPNNRRGGGGHSILHPGSPGQVMEGQEAPWHYLDRNLQQSGLNSMLVAHTPSHRAPS